MNMIRKDRNFSGLFFTMRNPESQSLQIISDFIPNDLSSPGRLSIGSKRENYNPGINFLSSDQPLIIERLDVYTVILQVNNANIHG